MSKELYSDQELLELGKSNYEKLVLHCQTLETAGLWEKARQVMQQSSVEVLDLYVQSVLMKLAIHCGNAKESQIVFICTVPVSNPLGINKENFADQDIQKDIDRIYNLPPILIQLCSLYDKEKGADITEYFMDSLLNILRCMTYLDSTQNPKINEFIQKYYNKINYYIEGKTSSEHSRYIFKKISNDRIACDVILPKKAKTTGKKKAALSKEQGAKEKSISQDEEKDRQIPKKKEKKIESVGEGKIESTDVEKKADQEKKMTYPDAGEEKKILEEQAREQFMLVKKRIQERELEQEKEREKRLQALMEELNQLVGLSNVKKEIQSLINLIKIRKLRRKMNLPEMDMSYHMVFTGSPGTGKTTVARLVARIYKELGILSKGQLIETDRSGLVAGYVGQTAIKVHDIVEQALGGILFIDEAYSLVNPEMPNDFGSEAVDALVKLMEDHRDDLVVIVAGYTEEMEQFLKSNTGLISRFNKFIAFPDYTKKELVTIMGVMAKNAGLKMDAAAERKVLNMLYRKKDQDWEDFGNARGIRNLFEKFIMNQANRLVQLENPTKEDLITIQKEDVAV